MGKNNRISFDRLTSRIRAIATRIKSYYYDSMLIEDANNG